MVFEKDLIPKDELKVGNVYKKELLDFYAGDYNCMLVIPDSPANVYFSDSTSNYKVKQIIDDCSISVPNNGVLTHRHCKKIIIIERVH